ncbi:MAG: UDP-N-acetylmuramoyl-L-alanyl-D-glutamate--2,6-diaminopimelate ligase, partial [Gammaproteobacteria bacterium]|nr:UDP-N-acetylmuramoyl-L-alanyl-D-glutamate--2,6-diaminopimelate ligase [Gammaproteobacteria bacterium]
KIGFKNLSNVSVIRDRAQAIQYAIKTAGVDDVILIAGKGHESYQLIGKDKIPFSDIKTVRNCMRTAK